MIDQTRYRHSNLHAGATINPHVYHRPGKRRPGRAAFGRYLRLPGFSGENATLPGRDRVRPLISGAIR
jgi:hypothetical protein